MGNLANTLKQKVFRDVMTDLLGRNYESRERFGLLLSEALVEESLREHVLPCLGELPGVTVKDMLDVWGRIPHPEPSAASEACEEFTKLLIAETTHHWFSDPIAVGPPSFWEYGYRSEPDKLWQSEDEQFAAFIIGQMPAGGKREAEEGEFPENARLHITITGKCTRRFFDTLCPVVSSAVSTLLRIVNDLFSEALMEYACLGVDRPDSSEVVDDAITTLYLILDVTGAQTGVTATTADDGETWVTEPMPEMAYNSRQFMEHSLKSLFLDVPAKKDSIARRVKNAIRLIAESDNQRHNPIGLALSVTAIEALLCRKGDNLSQMFGENMAALLEPHPVHRLEAERWSKRLYDLRSGILHGSDLDCSPRDIRQAKLAAGMVLRAMLERRAAIKRVGGNDENPDEFLAELRSGKYRPGQLTHVSELPLKRFWRYDSPKRSE